MLPVGCLREEARPGRPLSGWSAVPCPGRFHSRPGHIPRLRVRSLVGACLGTAVSLSRLLPSALRATAGPHGPLHGHVPQGCDAGVGFPVNHSSGWFSLPFRHSPSLAHPRAHEVHPSLNQLLPRWSSGTSPWVTGPCQPIPSVWTNVGLLLPGLSHSPPLLPLQCFPTFLHWTFFPAPSAKTWLLAPSLGALSCAGCRVCQGEGTTRCPADQLDHSLP